MRGSIRAFRVEIESEREGHSRVGFKVFRKSKIDRKIQSVFSFSENSEFEK